jgi:hypothetical protein
MKRNLGVWKRNALFSFAIGSLTWAVDMWEGVANIMSRAHSLVVCQADYVFGIQWAMKWVEWAAERY